MGEGSVHVLVSVVGGNREMGGRVVRFTRIWQRT
jgi:hypothetical protein